MATLAVPRRELNTASIPLLVLLVGMAGLMSGVVGTAWDVSWHRTIGRDSFWILPHVFTYAGAMLNGIAALLATSTAMAGRRVRGRELRIGALRAELGVAFVGIATALIILSAPFDDAWHRAIGPDVDIWSPPHLAAIAASSLIYLGWGTALAPGVFPIGERLRRVLRVAMFGAWAGMAIFATNFYYFMAVTREALFYPVLVCAVIPLVLAAGDVVTGEPYARTKIALWYTGVSLLVIGGLQLEGWRPPAFPPLVVAGAIAVDLLRRRTASPLLLGAAFAIAFVAAEWARMTLFPAPAPTTLVAGPDRGSQLFFQYYGQALARPWLSAWPLAAIAIGTLAAALGSTVGGRLGRWLGGTSGPVRKDA
ncbi:MAG TPA: hypothetical protein VHG53_06355 [Candidatus Limnocylindria bacterium]|nr:hypothetical protein [Candidatus Limnocylindria bacterium]